MTAMAAARERARSKSERRKEDDPGCPRWASELPLRSTGADPTLVPFHFVRHMHRRPGGRRLPRVRQRSIGRGGVSHSKVSIPRVDNKHGAPSATVQLPLRNESVSLAGTRRRHCAGRNGWAACSQRSFDDPMTSGRGKRRISIRPPISLSLSLYSA